MARRRFVPLSACALVFLDYLWIPACWLAFFLAWLGSEFVMSGATTMFRETVDVPAEVVDSWAYSESTGKGTRWHGHRVLARFKYGDVLWTAAGDVTAVPKDKKVLARVPIHRPELSVIFTGRRPLYRQQFVMLGINVAIGFGMAGWMIVAAVRMLRLLTQGTLARVRSTELRRYKSRVVLDTTLQTPAGHLRWQMNVHKDAAARMFAEESPVIAYWEEQLGKAVPLAEIAGLRWEPASDSLAPAPWSRLAWRALPMLWLLAGVLYGLKRAMLLPPEWFAG